MVKFIIGIVLVAGLGSAYIFAFRSNNKDGNKNGGCGGCSSIKCSGCAFRNK